MQQTAELANRKLKNDLIRTTVPLTTHESVVARLVKVVKTWKRVLKESELRTDRPVTLMAPSMTLGQPSFPDGWLLGEFGRQERRPYTKAKTHFVTVGTILKKMRATQGRAKVCFDVYNHWIAMACGKPRAVPAGTAEKLVKHMKVKHAAECRRMLMTEGIIGDENKIFPKKVTELFTGTWCVINSTTFTCTCWRYRWRGRCVHSYAIQEWAGHRRWTPVPLPAADEVIDGEDSAAEEAPAEVDDLRRVRRRLE